MSCRSYFGEPLILHTLEAPPSVWPEAGVQVCHLPLLRAVRFGPFVSTPERGWRTFLSGPLLGLLADGDRVVGNANQPVLEDGTPIGYPPLHNHHVHVRKGDRQRNLGRTTNNHWFESHGDYPDGPSYGFGAPSTAGYATTLPPGYCVLVDEAADLDVEAEVNDVRRRSPQLAAADAPLTWYLQVAFALSDRPCRAASKAWFRFATSVALADDWWLRYDVPNRPALSWWSGAMPASGALLKAWIHSHRLRYDSLLFLAASPEELGCTPFVPEPQPRPRTRPPPFLHPHLHLYTTESHLCTVTCSSFGISAVKGDYALGRNLSWTRELFLHRGRGRVVCQTAPHAPSAVHVAAQPRAGIVEGMYDRRGALACNEWRFEQGAPWTIVAFHAPRWEAGVSHVKQHTELWMYLDTGGARSESFLPDWGAEENGCHEVGVEGGGEARDGDAPPWWLSLVPGVHPAGFLQLASEEDEGTGGPPSGDPSAARLRRDSVSRSVLLMGVGVLALGISVRARRSFGRRRQREYAELLEPAGAARECAFQA